MEVGSTVWVGRKQRARSTSTAIDETHQREQSTAVFLASIVAGVPSGRASMLYAHNVLKKFHYPYP